MSKSQKILLADEAEPLNALAQVLAEYNPSTCTNLQEGLKLLAEQIFDLFIIGVHFDESNAMQFVNEIRSRPSSQTTPIIIVRALPTNLSESIKQVMLSVKRAGLISEYLELTDDSQAPVFAAVARVFAQTP
jgi:DNA-binding response OmpR family regulator